jgi:hypothetical protein
MAEIFKIKNTSTNEIELIDFGIIISPNTAEELEDPNRALLSNELNAYLQNGDLQRLINDASVPYNEAFYSTTEIYGFDSSTIDGSINQLFSEKSNLIYVDGSLNLKVNRIIFDASILSLTNKNISQDASILLRPLTSYVDGSLNLKVNKAGDTMTGDLVFSGAANRYIRRDTSTLSLSIWGGNSEANGAYFQITGSGYAGSPYGGSAEFVIRDLSQSQFSLFSYDGLSTWTPRFSLSGNTGLATFSNDVSILGSLRIGNDSSIGTNLPYAQIDVNNGKKIIRAGNYYGQYFQYAESLAESTTTSTTPQTKVTLTTPASLPSGTYKITAVAKGRCGSTSSDMRFRVYQGGTPLGTTDINIEPQDTASYYPIVIVHYLTISGAQTFTFRYSSENGGTTTYIVDATLELIRVN